jgi:hypothetical protein
MLRRTLTLVLTSMVLASTAEAGALNPWGVPAGAGVFGINPYLYVFPNDDGTSGANLYPILYLSYGFTDSVDLIVGQSFYFGGNWGSGADVLEIMPRYFWSDTMGIALHAKIGTYSGGPFEIGPELQAAWSTDALDFGLNLNYLAYNDPAGFDAGSINVILAPERYLSDAVSVYLEVDASYALTADVDPVFMQVVPGVSWSFAETHYFSLGVQIPFVPEFDSSLIAPGIWYYTSFGGSDEE